MRFAALLAVAGALVSLYDTSCTEAQVRASEAATVSQTVDGTVITVAYSRPQARGRSSLFGSLVHYGETWTPGANWATTLEASKDVQVNGTALAEGKYSVWMIPNAGEWTVIFDRDARRFHTQRPRQSDSQIRVTVRPDSGSHIEVLTWAFPVIRSDGTTLEMRWGTTRVALDISVEPTGRGRLAGSADAYVGTYRMRFVGPEGDGPESSMNVFERDSTLYVLITPAAFPDVDSEILLQTAGTHRFTPVFQKEGRIYDVERDAALVFTVVNGRATAIELQGIDGRVMAKGVREQ
jgi:hypothetical protein